MKTATETLETTKFVSRHQLETQCRQIGPCQPGTAASKGSEDMYIQRKAGLHLVLIVAAALGCSVSVMSGTVAAIQYSAADTITAQG
jgi:hypothetical protein